MPTSWFYSHHGKACGPVSTDEIKALAAKGLLDGRDLLWPEGMPEKATLAEAALDFSRFPAPGDPVLAGSAGEQPLPDWLEDVGRLDRKGPCPPLRHSDEVPGWLDDLRIWFGLDVYAAVKRASQKTRSVVTASRPTHLGMPDWLQSWIVPETPRASAPTQPPAAIVLGQPPAATPVSPANVEIPAPLPITIPALPARAAKPTICVASAPKTQLATPSFEAYPLASEAVVRETANLAAEKTLQETGFDVKTGQILDGAKFETWKRQNAQPASAEKPGYASLFEVFRKARIALGTWVDGPNNQAKVLHADVPEITASPAIQAILQEYVNYGKNLREKLVQHLEFLVENRRKHDRAVARGTK